MARYFSRMVWICKNTASQPTIYAQHNFYPFEFHSIQSLTKVGDTEFGDVSSKNYIFSR